MARAFGNNGGACLRRLLGNRWSSQFALDRKSFEPFSPQLRPLDSLARHQFVVKDYLSVPRKVLMLQGLPQAEASL